MTMKWELTKMAMMFGGALLTVNAMVSVLEILARHH